MKKYLQPIQKETRVSFASEFLQVVTASGEGIKYGGEGDDEDDPDAKVRTDKTGNEDDIWGSLW